jgi:glycerol uptake facilitator-like aquaporin
MTLGRRLTAEGAGTALLLAGVVGSGIMGERLAGGNTAIALLANTLATGAVLVALIVTFGPISGAHFNPAVTRRRMAGCSAVAGGTRLRRAAALRRVRRGHVRPSHVR